MDFELLFLGYWPKLVIAVWFSILNIIMVYRYLGKKQYILERFVVLFLLSSSFLSIIGEQLIIRVYNNLVDSHVFVDDNNLFFIAMNIIADATIIFIGGNLFTKFTGLNNFVGATVYMEFVCIERMCLVVAVSYLGFITFYFLLQLLFTLLFF